MKSSPPRFFPPALWLAEYRASWLRPDIIAGVTLAAYAIPVSLAYATLAGLPPQIGIYGYMLGGIGYALLGSSRQLAVGPTSAISLMIAAAVGPLAAGDEVRYAQVASVAAFAVALLCLIAWLFRLNMLVRLISDSILVGFKAGAGLTIVMTQLPSLFGVAGGGHNFFDRAVKLAGQFGDMHVIVLAIGLAAIALLLLGARFLPGRPVGLAVVVLSILLATFLGLPALGVAVTGEIPKGLPGVAMPTFGLLEFDELFPLAAGVLLLAYVEGVSAARSFAAKHGYPLDARQEFLGLGAANLLVSLCHGYPVAGGLSQSAVNDQAGARTPLALVICSITLAVCLLFLTGLLTNLPKAVLAAIVFTAVYKLVDVVTLVRCGGSAGSISMPPSSRWSRCCCSASCRASYCSPRSSCCWHAPHSRTSRSLADCQEPAAMPTARGIRMSNRSWASSHSVQRRRCFTSMQKPCWRQSWQGFVRRRTSNSSYAASRLRLSSILRAPKCCTTSMASSPCVASPSRSSARAGRSAMSCRRMA